MKIKNLLSLGLTIGYGISAQAQIPVFHEGFDAAQTKQSTDVAWYEFINQEEGDDWSVASDGSYQGSGCLNFFNADVKNASSWWRRGVKFRNLPLQEGKSYRLVHYLKGSNTYTGDDASEQKCHVSVALMQGGENADIPLLDANGNEFRYDYQYLNPDSYEKYTRMFFFASEALQKSTYAANNPDKDPLVDTFFASINIYNPGEFYLDEVDLVESTIAGITYRGDVIRVDLGYATNAKTLAALKKYYALPVSSATVKYNGEEKTVESVEVRDDGYLYIFLEEEIEDEGDIEVTFANPDDSEFVYSGTLTPGGAVLGFTENGQYDEDFNADGEIVSYLYSEPALESTVPVDGSFALDADVSEFTFVFDKEVYSVANDAKGAPVATLSDGTVLTLKDGTPEVTNSLTFVRKGGDLAKGSYTVTLKDVVSSKGTESLADYTISFEVGKINLAKTEYTKVVEGIFPEAEVNGIPEGWTVVSEGEVREYPNTYGSAGRTFATAAVQGKGIYTRKGSTDASVTSPKVTLPKGDIEVRALLAYWSGTSEIQVDICNSNDEVVATKNFTPTVAGEANRNNTGFAFEECPVQFSNAAEGEYYVKYTLLTDGYNGMFVGGFEAYTYTVTEGDKSDAQVVFAESFASNDGNMPSAESGWLCYNAGTQLEAGSGRNGTSGFLQKNFGSKMQNAFLSRECGDNKDASHRLTYADENSGHDPLKLSAGSYEITFYCGTWNDATGNANGTSMTYFQLIDAATGEVALDCSHVNKANFENGGKADGTVEADKVVLNFNTQGGEYTIKAWGSTNTVVGAFSFEKQGSKAAKYYQKLADAVDLAKAELEKSEDAVNDGDTKTNLAAAIAKYSGESDMHTAAEYDAAVEEVENLTAAMKTRRETIGTYETAKTNIAEYIETIAEKYNALECVTALKEAYSKYGDVAAQTLSDAELVSAANTLDFDYNTAKNMTNEGVGILTEQITKLAAKIVELDETKADDEVVLAAGNAISDDQALAAQLRLRLTKAIYDKCAEGNPFEMTYFDENLQEDVTDEVTIEAQMYVQNPNIYCVAEKHDATTIVNYPGWKTDEDHQNFALRPNFGWGGWTGSATHLINNNMFLGIGWVSNDGLNVWTDVESLPVGVYDITVQTMDRSGAGNYTDGANEWTNPEYQQSYIYYQQPDMEEAVTKAFNVENIGQYYDFSDDVISDVTLTGETTASLKLGAYIHAQESFAAIQQVQLSLKAKATGFDYAAAAAKLSSEIAASIENTVLPAGEPSSVKYYTIDGKQTRNPKGVAIKVATWKNGFTKISKVVLK